MHLLPRRRRASLTALAVVGIVAVVAVGAGTSQLEARGWKPAARSPPPLPPRLTIARVQYEGGGDWYANPSSIPNLLEAIATRTSLKVEKREARVKLMDDALW